MGAVEERTNEENEITVFCCTVKSPATQAEQLVQVIRVAGVCADTRTTVRAKSVTQLEYCKQLNLIKMQESLTELG